MQITALVLTSPGQRYFFSAGGGRTGSVKTAARLTAGHFFKRILLPYTCNDKDVCLLGWTDICLVS